MRRYVTAFISTDHPAKISGTEYLNLAFMNGISGTGMALMEIL